MGWFSRLVLGDDADGPDLEQEAAQLRKEEAAKKAKERKEKDQ